MARTISQQCRGLGREKQAQVNTNLGTVKVHEVGAAVEGFAVAMVAPGAVRLHEPGAVRSLPMVQVKRHVAEHPQHHGERRRTGRHEAHDDLKRGGAGKQEDGNDEAEVEEGNDEEGSNRDVEFVGHGKRGKPCGNTTKEHAPLVGLGRGEDDA